MAWENLVTNTSIENGTSVFQKMFVESTFLGMSNFFNLVLTAFTLIMICQKDVKKWSVLSFPVMVLWHVIGVKANILALTIAGIAMVLGALSKEMLGGMLETIKGKMNDRDKIRAVKREQDIIMKGFKERRKLKIIDRLAEEKRKMRMFDKLQSEKLKIEAMKKRLGIK